MLLGAPYSAAPAMALRATTIRFDDTTADWVQVEAREAGVSFSQFVREATVIRATVRRMIRSGELRAEDFIPAVAAISERVAEMSRADNG